MDFEEGRVALHFLEGQLKGVVQVQSHLLQRPLDDAGSVGSRPSLNSERRIMLDQVPRDTRLHYRQGSPLGLTVEELDDRGLLDGGGSVPNYYTSSRHRSRRPLEMKKRSSRLQERGKETPSKLISALFHMIQTLVRRGLPIESYCRHADLNGCGLMDKKNLTAMLKGIGMPFAPKDMTEISSRYTVPSAAGTSEMVDYEALLKDAGVFSQDLEVEGLESVESLSGTDISMYTGVLVDVKRMLLESAQSLGKTTEDVHRMFARWDNDGAGTVTATQFLRVLARMHVNLSDQDQDLVVELLDTNAKGRIDFISLLRFCFQESSGSPDHQGSSTSASAAAATSANGIADDATSGNGETVSAVSTEGGLAEQKSVGSNNGSNSRRPHTATSTRPVVPDNYNNRQRCSLDDRDKDGSIVSNRPLDPKAHNSKGGGGIGLNSSFTATKGQRPLTASARVSTNQHEGRSHHQSSVTCEHQQDGEKTQIQFQPARRVDDAHFVMEMADDVIDDNEDLMLLTPQSVYQRHRHEDAYAGVRDETVYDGGIDGHDGASFNDNTLVTDQDEYYFGSPQGHLAAMHSRDLWNSQSLDGLTASQENQLPSQSNKWSQEAPNDAASYPGSQHIKSAPHEQEPNDHLPLLANQTLTTVREMLMGRWYRMGKSLEEIYQHFDRRGKGHFDAQDFIRATSDLRIETSNRVAHFAITQIALDGRNHVTLGEFKVFLLDEDHWKLESNIQQQMATLLERQGRKFQSRLYHVFWEQDEALGGGGRTQAAETGLVRKEAFLAGMQMLHLRATASEIERLSTRFDINGDGLCSVTRFLQMAQSSQAWQSAEKTLAIQEEAQEEADALRRQIRETGSMGQAPAEEVIAMAEYLGIRAVSEQHLLWIANDALKAPLPVNWTAQRDDRGRVFFYNHINSESRWDHPLDPHFRSLRDKYRQGDNDGVDEREMEDAQLLGTISFGGVGATLVPRPLNIHLHSTDGDRPIFPGDKRAGTKSPHRNAARPNSAGALLGHGVARQGTSSGLAPMNSRLPPTVSLHHDDHAMMNDAKRSSNRPRPQSALPERLTAFPSTVPSSSFDRTVVDNKTGELGIMDYGIAMNGFDIRGGGRLGENRPSSAPNYLSAGLMQHYGRIGMPLPAAALTSTGGGAHDVTARKYKKAESIYRAPYFNMAVFNKDSAAGGGVGPAPDFSQGRRSSHMSAGNGKPNQPSRPQSAVDRAVNLGKVIPSYLLPREKDRTAASSTKRDDQNAAAFNQKIAYMYDDDNLAHLLGDATKAPPFEIERERVRDRGHPVVGRMPPVVPRATRRPNEDPSSSLKGGIVILN